MRWGEKEERAPAGIVNRSVRCRTQQRRIRCGGFDYPLQRPKAAIDPSEEEVSISTAMMLRDQLAQAARPEGP
jgi:hypothetical protein